MDQHEESNRWRQIFDNGRRSQPAERNDAPSGQDHARTHGGGHPGSYDDGYDPAREADAARQHAQLSPEDIADEAAILLALDAQEYRPWVLQRGRSRPVMMLHLRRYEPKSGLWMGWQLSYPSLIAVEYIGDKMLSLDFGARQFVLEGEGFGELVGRLQTGQVICVQEYSPTFWSAPPTGPRISAIRLAVASS